MLTIVFPGRLACKITSPLVFAHVRAAYPGMPVSEQNCHPFQASRSGQSSSCVTDHCNLGVAGLGLHDSRLIARA